MSSVLSNKPVTSKSEDLDLGRIVGEIIDHYKIIISMTVILTLLAIVYALFATPIYQADALIQVEQKQGNAILNSLSQVLPDSQPQSAPEIALMQSRMILDKTIDELNLQIIKSPDFFPIFGKGWARLTHQTPGDVTITNLYMPSDGIDDPKITLTIIDKSSYRVENDNISLVGHVGVLLESPNLKIKVSEINAAKGTSFTVKYQTKLEAINNLLKVLSITDQGKDTGMLNLSLTGDNPILLSQILDSISSNYVDQNIARQAAQDAKSLDFLQLQLPKVRSDLNAAEDKLNQYRRQKDSVDLTMESQSVLNQIVNVDNQLNELTFREAEISQLYTKEHPTYKALNEKRQTLLDEKSKLNQKVSQMPATQQEVMRLSRDVDSGRAVYMQLLNRQQELSIAKASAIGNARIIDNAVTEPKPIKPNKILVVLIGFVLGVFISVFIVLVKVFLRRGIESPEEVEELGVSVYASVPESDWLTKYLKKPTIKLKSSKKPDGKNNPLLAINNPADLAIEAMRSLRTSLHFAMMEAKNKILMISGSSPESGKTFISSNLAVIIANTGKKVLFIDADMRRGYINKSFGVDNEKGLSTYLSGIVPINEIIKRIDSAGIDFISRGKISPNPAELLMHSRFEDLLRWASENYDLVIIDSPPILAVTDAAIIGRHVGTTLLVVRFEGDTSKEVETSIKRFQQSGVSVKGCILNRIVKKASSYYNYGYSQYGYTYENRKDN
ncbi:polysaccharide biosynthesis tyrosine autokinase [Rahnella sp. SAP-1]|uniref:Polysaccharide biosynthesis tyrosine autokinase n=1 Tax=Rouxiella aceris TaxID=2703884 RepID=A0A848MDE9_9GAMM|nr:polysaccharide biosynthesis tyrosine autokinase [Rouxiella aceris]NMP25685.1 polysaccharide biosynthesis tyrosine autokinase [Rouxiella aceris]